jgi:hypothetical protein
VQISHLANMYLLTCNERDTERSSSTSISVWTAGSSPSFVLLSSGISSRNSQTVTQNVTTVKKRAISAFKTSIFPKQI